MLYLIIFKKALDKYSGKDPIALLCAYFHTPQGKKHVSQVVQGLNEVPLFTILNNIKKQHEKAPALHKRQWLSLVATVFTRKWLQSQGFQFTTNQYSHARQYAADYGAGTPFENIPKQLPPSKQPISEEIKKQVSFSFINLI